MPNTHVQDDAASNTGPWAVRLDAVTARAPGPDWSAPLSLTVSRGSRVGVIGANGSGKSTLLALIAGRSAPAGGRVLIAPELAPSYLPQAVSLQGGLTVRESVEAGASSIRSMLARHEELSAKVGADPSPELLDELGGLVDSLDATHGWDLDAQISQASAALGCPNPGTFVEDLSAGERRRVALCRLLLSRPSLLLLDEPSNDLDLDGTDWLEHYLQSYAGTVVFASHDRQLLNACAQWIVELDRSGLHRYRGGYSDYLDVKVNAFVVTGNRDADQLLALEREHEWSRSQQPSRATSRRRRLTRPDNRTRVARGLGLVPVPSVSRLGHDVLSCEGLTIHAGSKLVVEDLTVTVPPAAIVGIVGPNGAGKSTLLRTLAGRHAPSRGILRIGTSVSIGFSDTRTLMGAEAASTAAAIMSASGDLRFGDSVVAPRSFLAAFGFRGADQDKPLSMLSGGERARLNIALTFRKQANLMLLDEPTNELDLTIRIALEQALDAFAGSVIVASHDRWFLNRLATHLLVWDGDAAHPAKWRWVDGGLDALRSAGTSNGSTEGARRRFPQRQREA